MSKHDSEDDFLDTVYQQTAQEKPPLDLDKKILALAKAKHQRKRFAIAMSLQRALSVAAVMILSVYIFFDVSRDHSSILDEGHIYPQQKALKSAPQLERLDMNDESQVMQRVFKEKAKTSAAKETMNYMSDDISELASEAPKLSQQKRNAESILEEIKQLLALGKKEEAIVIHEQFKRLFPDYPVSEFIREAIEEKQ